MKSSSSFNKTIYRLPKLLVTRSANLFIVCACLLMSLVGAATHVQAQGESLGLTPAMIDANVKRGATYNQGFTIANNTRTRLRFHASVGDYWYGEKNERLVGRAGTLPRSASPWVQFTPAEVVIEPNSSATINAVISVPQAANGGYYTMPFFEGEPADLPAGGENRKGAGSSVAIRLGGLLMLTTDEGSEYNVEVMGGTITPPTESSELEMKLDVRNRGTAHARLKGMFAILDEAGKISARGRIEEKPYLPGQRKMFETSWAGNLAPGRYTAIVTLTYDRAGKDPATVIHEIPFEQK